ncbi:MAG TPA: hypothetical protein VNI53_09540 [Gammaproteobacteria bacterium]|nr:hypothetical protein [Gammaproteobacteria bacterium]
MKKFLIASALFVLSATTALAADNPWVGIWKPDPAKSNDYAEVKLGTMIIASPSVGVLRWQYPAMRFKMEGKPDGSDMSLTYPTKPKGLTETVTLLTPQEIDLRGQDGW